MSFQMEASGAGAAQVIDLYWRSFDPDPEGRAYADAALLGIAGSQVEVDAEITKASTHWRLERMARVDRNVLRLGAWELLRRTDVPRAVILDQVENGVAVRMAVLYLLAGGAPAQSEN